MSTKWKIFSGFVTMILILAVVVFLGVRSVRQNTAGLTDYQRRAKLNVACSDIELLLTSAQASLRGRLVYRTDINSSFGPRDQPGKNPQVDFIRDARARVEQALGLIDTTEPLLRRPEEVELFRELKKDVLKYQELISAFDRILGDSATQYTQVVTKRSQAVLDQLEMFVQKAHGEEQILIALSSVWRNVSMTMVQVSELAYSKSYAEAADVHDQITKAERATVRLRSTLNDPELIREFESLRSRQATAREAVKVMEEMCLELTKVIEDIRNCNSAIQAKTKLLNRELDDRMTLYGNQAMEDNLTAEWFMMAVGLIGLIMGAVLSTVIVVSMIRVFRRLSLYATAVSHGDFTQDVGVKEKGEIGEVIAAMQNIPQTLNNLIATAGAMAQDIRGGLLRHRMQADSLEGSFSDLGGAVNSVSDAYTEVVDALPLPVLACDREARVLFANTRAGQVFGIRSGKDRDPLAASMENGMVPHGKQAMDMIEEVSGETRYQGSDGPMELAVTAKPLFGSGQQPSGYLMIVTDLTEVRQKQLIILNVAQRALVISDRLAAAADQLAAQVNQVSRGAEVQRQRMENTVAAMGQMSTSVAEVAYNASEASDQGGSARQKAETGASLVNQVVTAISRISELGDTLDANMQQLGQLATNIGGVMNVISDIADQTNLLALNAAIEAARAGDAGRGFAVVADEVRKLAEKTMEATREVGESITAIQTSARINMQEVHTSVASISKAAGLAHQSGQALEEIVELATLNVGVMSSIATAVEEQSKTSEQINLSVEEIHRITADMTDGMIQASNAVYDLSEMARELKSVMDNLT